MSSHFPEMFHSYFVKEKAFFLQEKITTFCLLGFAFRSLVKFCYISYYYLVRILPQHVSSISLAWNKTTSFPGHVAQWQTCNCNYPLKRVSFSQLKMTIKFCAPLRLFTFFEEEITQVQVTAETIREYKNTYKQQSKYYCLYR